MTLVRSIILCLLLSASLNSFAKTGEKAQAINGILDLRNADLNESFISLSGEWKFYWKKLLAPTDWQLPPDQLIQYPTLWRDQQMNGLPLTSKGYATYALTVYLPKGHPSLGLHVPDAFSTYELFINGKSVIQNGRPDSIAKRAIPFWTTQTIGISNSTDTLHLMLHVANYWHAKGGPYKQLTISSRKNIMLDYRREASVDLTLAGCLFMGGLFFLGLFIFSRKNTPILFFSLFCMIYSYRMVGTKLYILHSLIPDVSWFVTVRLEYLTLVLAVACFSQYSRCLYPRETNKYFMLVMLGCCLGYSIVIIFCPPYIFTGLINAFLGLMFAFIVYAFYVYVQAVRHQRSGAVYALISTAVMLLIFLLINLEYFGLIAPVRMLTFIGYIIFFFLQSLVLSRRFSESFRQAALEAQQGLVAKSEFLSTMSHEIRTPLNSVIGMAHLLQRSQPRVDQKENLDVLLFSANNLLSIVNNILDYNKIEAGKISIEQINMDLPAIARNIVAGLKTLSEEKRIELNLEIDPAIDRKVVGDPTRTAQVITNLLHNAIKFTKNGSVSLKLSAGSIVENRMSVTVSVTDTGIGIPEAKQQLIFERFTQADSSTSRSYGGTGLGLSISKKILELQGSELKLKSVAGEGSTFYFTQLFPLTTEKTEMVEDTVAKQDESELLRNVNILLVEDNPINVLVAQTFLERCGAQIDVAGNGEEALDKFDSEKHQLVLMDLEMPVLDGYDATRQLRKRGESIPVIALTASLPKEVESDVYAAGLTDIIVKPFNPDDLFRVILQHLNTRAA